MSRYHAASAVMQDWYARRLWQPGEKAPGEQSRWRAEATLPDGRVWRDSGDGPCPDTIRVPQGSADILVVTDDGRPVGPRIIGGSYHLASRLVALRAAGFPKEYPLAGDTVGGLRVTDDIPNTSSISASMMEYEILDGVREVPMSHFPGRKARSDRKGSSDLAREIEENGWIDPLIVGIDADAVEKGPYILEGAHRFDALAELGIESFPALVVLDTYGSVPVADPGVG